MLVNRIVLDMGRLLYKRFMSCIFRFMSLHVCSVMRDILGASFYKLAAGRYGGLWYCCTTILIFFGAIPIALVVYNQLNGPICTMRLALSICIIGFGLCGMLACATLSNEANHGAQLSVNRFLWILVIAWTLGVITCIVLIATVYKVNADEICYDVSFWISAGMYFLIVAMMVFFGALFVFARKQNPCALCVLSCCNECVACMGECAFQMRVNDLRARGHRVVIVEPTR